MQGDNVVRFLLTLIAAALIVLVVQGFDRGGASEEVEAAGRYTLNMLRTRRGLTLLRLDSHTGQVWSTNPDRGDAWTEVGTGSDMAPEPEDAAESPAPRMPLKPGAGITAGPQQK
jgi:hypothetical protein